jgi:hypothetical protein
MVKFLFGGDYLKGKALNFDSEDPPFTMSSFIVSPLEIILAFLHEQLLIEIKLNYIKIMSH